MTATGSLVTEGLRQMALAHAAGSREEHVLLSADEAACGCAAAAGPVPGRRRRGRSEARCPARVQDLIPLDRPETRHRPRPGRRAHDRRRDLRPEKVWRGPGASTAPSRATAPSRMSSPRPSSSCRTDPPSARRSCAARRSSRSSTSAPALPCSEAGLAEGRRVLVARVPRAGRLGSDRRWIPGSCARCGARTCPG